MANTLEHDRFRRTATRSHLKRELVLSNNQHHRFRPSSKSIDLEQPLEAPHLVPFWCRQYGLPRPKGPNKRGRESQRQKAKRSSERGPRGRTSEGVNRSARRPSDRPSTAQGAEQARAAPEEQAIVRARPKGPNKRGRESQRKKTKRSVLPKASKRKRGTSEGVN